MEHLREAIDAQLKILLSDYFELEKIIQTLPNELSGKFDDFKNELSSLSKALDVIPEKFDETHAKKINDIIDVATEIDNHTKELNAAIKESMETFNTNFKHMQENLREESREILIEQTKLLTIEAKREIEDIKTKAMYDVEQMKSAYAQQHLSVFENNYIIPKWLATFGIFFSYLPFAGLAIALWFTAP